MPEARGPVRGTFVVPASKSLHQRALVLAALADGTSSIDARVEAEVADDVRSLTAALTSLGRWEGIALGTSRDRRTVHLGAGATGFRFVVALSALRPEGARTLVRGDRRLLDRPHQGLLRALERLGGRAKRRRSGSVRVLGGGLHGGDLAISGRTSSQYASALMLVAPRTQGLRLRIVERPVSAPYLLLTAEALRAFGVSCAVEPAGASGLSIVVGDTPPRGTRYTVPPDASAAAAWWTAAALTGGEARVEGLGRVSSQPDAALLPLLERMGCRVEEDGAAARVRGGRLASPGEVDLRDAPDLLPLVAVLSARADGPTRISGVAHARGKESDRVREVGRLLSGLGARVEEHGDGLTVAPAPLRGTVVDVRADHRLAFAFGVLGLVVPGIVLRGAESTHKSHPGFLRDLARAVS